jgi:hypothetical protein
MRADALAEAEGKRHELDSRAKDGEPPSRKLRCSGTLWGKLTAYTATLKVKGPDGT